MSYTAEITERSLSRDRQALLTSVLVRELNVEPEEAALTALVMPALVGPFETAADRDAFLVALAEAGFAARPGTLGAPEHAPPDYAPPAYDAPAYVPPAYVPPAYVLPAAPPGGYPPAAPVRSSNGTLIGVAVLLAVIAAALAAVLLTQDTGGRTEAPLSDTPPGSSGVSGGSSEAVDIGDAPAPARTDDADFALGFSPSRGVNWDLFTTSQVTRYASAPNRTPVPIRDMPSARHGTVTGEVAPGGEVTTGGCLPRRQEDGGRWCQVEGDAGWIYDRYLTSAPPPQAPPQTPSAAVQTAPPPPPPTPPSPSAPMVIVMGSYAPGDDAGLNARYALAQQTGLPVQIVPAAEYGMAGDYRVIVAGPYDSATALRLLGQVRAYVPDAFRKAIE